MVFRALTLNGDASAVAEDPADLAPLMELGHRLWRCSRECLLHLRCAPHVNRLRHGCLSFGDVRLQLRCVPSLRYFSVCFQKQSLVLPCNRGTDIRYLTVSRSLPCSAWRRVWSTPALLCRSKADSCRRYVAIVLFIVHLARQLRWCGNGEDVQLASGRHQIDLLHTPLRARGVLSIILFRFASCDIWGSRSSRKDGAPDQVSLALQLDKYRAEWERAALPDTQATLLGIRLQQALNTLQVVHTLEQLNESGSVYQLVEAMCFSCSGNAQGKLAKTLGVPNRFEQWEESITRDEVGYPFASLNRHTVGNEISALNFYAVQWLGNLLIPAHRLPFFMDSVIRSADTRTGKKLGLPPPSELKSLMAHYTDGEPLKEHSEFDELMYTTGWLFADALDAGRGYEEDRHRVAYHGRSVFGNLLCSVVRSKGARISHEFQKDRR